MHSTLWEQIRPACSIPPFSHQVAVAVYRRSYAAAAVGNGAETGAAALEHQLVGLELEGCGAGHRWRALELEGWGAGRHHILRTRSALRLAPADGPGAGAGPARPGGLQT
jgi:hypothetical protein